MDLEAQTKLAEACLWGAVAKSVYDSDDQAEMLNDAISGLNAYLASGGSAPDVVQSTAPFTPPPGDSDLSVRVAFASIQDELTDPQKDTSNDFFNSKYAALGSFLPAIRRKCYEHDCFLTFNVIGRDMGEGNKVKLGLRVELVHVETGGTMSGWYPFPDQNVKDAQLQGSILTYLNRYGVCLFFGLVAGGDDDGNSSSQRAQRDASIAGIGLTPAQVKDWCKRKQRPSPYDMNDKKFNDMIVWFGTDDGQASLGEK